jgi:hypothetical protein
MDKTLTIISQRGGDFYRDSVGTSYRSLIWCQPPPKQDWRFSGSLVSCLDFLSFRPDTLLPLFIHYFPFGFSSFLSSLHIRQMATLHLASWANALKYSDLPEDVIAAAVRSFYNWAGCAIGGSNHPATSIAVRYLIAKVNFETFNKIHFSMIHCSLFLASRHRLSSGIKASSKPTLRMQLF